jgi:hypothetical protein
MSIRPPLASRLIFAIAGGASAVVVLALIIIDLLTRHDLVVLLGLPLVAVFAGTAYWGGRSSWLGANETKVGHYPSLGRARTVARDHLAGIVRVQMGRTTVFEFRGKDDGVLFTAPESFTREDMQTFADYLKVPLRWDIVE